MESYIQQYNNIERTVKYYYQQLQFDKYKKRLGRKLAIPIEESIALALFKQKNNIATKKSLYEIVHPDCSYKTLVVNINRWFFLALVILVMLMRANRQSAHLIKIIDSTDIPVGRNKNAKTHKVLQGIASYSKRHQGKKHIYGLKLHLVIDANRNFLAIKFTSANVDDREVVLELTADLLGIFLADAGYVSQKLARDFYQENEKIIFAVPRKNMRKLMTDWQEKLLRKRMIIEFDFRSLKLFYGLVTSLPRSVDGYFANYIYALLAYQII